ncbi:DExH-box splicing factor binding site-domain-containing protein [Mycena alexandri]|uniref:DExH-box splicing factor binding site-domain-containing protein n=1 Tax=Mycena alexandri TaxID=1745969 RepID=A0AAD6T7G2_9AGAR|nr:DExH-box splicing factor binding site-domain-containing protein [Mycena alexandri]
MSKVSFTIRRPTPVSRDASSGPESDSSTFRIPALPRHLTQDSAPGSPLSRSRNSSPPARYPEPDSSDEDDEQQDELVTGFDAMGAQRLHKSKKVPQGPLVIPALKNRDWRELARKRRSASQFVPESAKAATGKDGSVGGLGVKDTINSGPVLSGLQVRAKVKKEQDDGEAVEEREAEMVVDVKEEEETEDQRALRAILAGADGMENTESMIDIIPTPMSEGDAYKQDVEELPDVATLDDYNRVPVAQFGLALLRGMGWKEGTAATRKPGKGMVQPYLPEARPALLGIGAKEREVLDDGSTKRSSTNKRPERRYVPVIKQDREGRPAGRESSRDDRARSPRRDNGSTSVSRRSSRSRSPGRRRDYDDELRKDSSRRESSYDDRKRESSRRELSYDSHRKESSRRDYDKRDDSDRYASSSKRRD